MLIVTPRAKKDVPPPRGEIYFGGDLALPPLPFRSFEGPAPLSSARLRERKGGLMGGGGGGGSRHPRKKISRSPRKGRQLDRNETIGLVGREGERERERGRERERRKKRKRWRDKSLSGPLCCSKQKARTDMAQQNCSAI